MHYFILVHKYYRTRYVIIDGALVLWHTQNMSIPVITPPKGCVLDPKYVPKSMFLEGLRHPFWEVMMEG